MGPGGVPATGVGHPHVDHPAPAARKQVGAHRNRVRGDHRCAVRGHPAEERALAGRKGAPDQEHPHADNLDALRAWGRRIHRVGHWNRNPDAGRTTLRAAHAAGWGASGHPGSHCRDRERHLDAGAARHGARDSADRRRMGCAGRARWPATIARGVLRCVPGVPRLARRASLSAAWRTARRTSPRADPPPPQGVAWLPQNSFPALQGHPRPPRNAAWMQARPGPRPVSGQPDSAQMACEIPPRAGYTVSQTACWTDPRTACRMASDPHGLHLPRTFLLVLIAARRNNDGHFA